MRFTTSLLLLISALTATALALPEPQPLPSEETGRPCGFKIAPCPLSQTCQKTDPTCTRGENCAGTCVANAYSSTVSSNINSPSQDSSYSPTTSSPAARPTYQSCGGHRVNPYLCAKDEICVDDPYKGGCGQACDMPGICVKPVFCGGFAGFKCKGGLKCVDDPRDDCDPKNGGADCGGICV